MQQNTKTGLIKPLVLRLILFHHELVLGVEVVDEVLQGIGTSRHDVDRHAWYDMVLLIAGYNWGVILI